MTSQVMPIAPAQFHQLAGAGRSLLATWEAAWPTFRQELEAGEGRLLCQQGCVPCCYARRFSSLCEAATIIEYIRGRFPAEEQEEMRLRVESTVSSLRRLRAEGCCESEEDFFRAGGLECPFLENGRCRIYPVRPLECRAMVGTSGDNVTDCRRCPLAVRCSPGQGLLRELQQAAEQEESMLGEEAALSQARPRMLAEAVSELWSRGAPATAALLTPEALEQRLSSRGKPSDETWQDDRHDYQALAAPLSLPKEGDYPGELTLLEQQLNAHEVYDWFATVAPGASATYTLYKRLPGSEFDWRTREFRSDTKGPPGSLPYTVWMSDGLQERLMMWEAAKRARGRVLCGGLGLGVFPQFALSLARVSAVHVIELDPDVIRLVKRGWSERPWAGSDRCTITEGRIEEFLATTDDKYDTVYVDTWDAIYQEYLPHLNELNHLAERVLNPGGEVLLWARDLMVRHFLRAALLVVERQEKYTQASADQMANIARQYPLLHKLVCWLKERPDCTSEALLTEAHRLATRERRDLGLLTLSRQPGAQDLLRRKYFDGQT